MPEKKSVAKTAKTTQSAKGVAAPKKTYDSASYASKFLPDKSIYQDDSRIFHRYGFEYEIVKEIKDARFADGRLTAGAVLSSGRKAKLSIQAYAEGTLRIQFGLPGARYDETSEMLVDGPRKAPKTSLKDLAESVELSFGPHKLILGKSPFTLRVVDKSGRKVFELETERIAGQHIAPPLGFRTAGDDARPFFSWRMENADRYYGLGEKFGKVEKSQTRATIWSADTCGSNTCDMSYKAVPVLHCTAGWGVMLHSSWRSFWEVGNWSYTAGSAMTEDPKLDLFLFFAPTLKGLVGKYTELTGRTQIPPKWALGVWMSRCQYRNKTEVGEVLERLRKEQIPCDVVHLDPMWMKKHYYYEIGVDACDFVKNDVGFPDLSALFREYKEKGFNTCLWINPYIPEGTPIYEEASKKGYLLKSVNGGLARLEHGQPVGMVDFTNPKAAAWWKGHLSQLLDDGASVFKPDYGDRVPEDAIFHNGRTGREMHNLYLYYFTKLPFEAVQEKTGQGVVWRRAGYIGSQRYPGTWAGDTQVTWQGLKGCFRGGLSACFNGEAFWSHDIGGFTGKPPSEELYCRWAQFGLLTPFSRFHGTTPREPWHYGKTALEVVQYYARLRYRLIPYLMACADEAAKTGLPLLRHMKLEFPDDPYTDQIEDQYMLGGDILVAPVINEGARSRPVFFPSGTWWSIDDATLMVEGPGFAEMDAPLNRIPVFARGGAVLPMFAEAPQHLKGSEPRPLVLNILPGDSKRVLRFEDGGKTIEIRYESKDGAGRLRINRLVAQTHVKLVGLSAGKVHAPGVTHGWNVDDDATTIVLEPSSGAFELEFHGDAL
jgi:alpha-D-xyloside xylohydrolase